MDSSILKSLHANMNIQSDDLYTTIMKAQNKLIDDCIKVSIDTEENGRIKCYIDVNDEVIQQYIKHGIIKKLHPLKEKLTIEFGEEKAKDIMDQFVKTLPGKINFWTSFYNIDEKLEKIIFKAVNEEEENEED